MQFRSWCLIGMTVALGSTAGAESVFKSDWPRWRGPHDNGSVEGGRYPVQWDAVSNVAWKAVLPGRGCSTPVVRNSRIYVTAPAEGQDALLAFDALSGKPIWQRALGPERAGKHRNGSGCNPSPVAEGQGIFVYFKSGTLARVDEDGRVRWKTNLQERFGKDTLYWDIGSTPVLTERDVVAAVMHHGESWLAAFDRQSGELHWKAARNYTTALEGDHSYATPLRIQDHGREALLVWGGEHLSAHDAADGKTLWACGDFNPEAKPNWPAVASPVIAGDIAVVPFGRGLRLHGIRLGGEGDVTATHRIWKREDAGSFVPTPAECGGRVYVLGDKGELVCVEPATGKTIWSGELPKDTPHYYASPLVAGGRLYAAREDGMIYVVGLDGKCGVEGANAMGERINASPVPLGNRLLLRTEQHLFCIGAE